MEEQVRISIEVNDTFNNAVWKSFEFKSNGIRCEARYGIDFAFCRMANEIAMHISRRAMSVVSQFGSYRAGARRN